MEKRSNMSFVYYFKGGIGKLLSSSRDNLLSTPLHWLKLLLTWLNIVSYPVFRKFCLYYHITVGTYLDDNRLNFNIFKC